jgi:hypothetical protein
MLHIDEFIKISLMSYCYHINFKNSLPITQEAKAEGSGVEVSLGYRWRLCPKIQTSKKIQMILFMEFNQLIPKIIWKSKRPKQERNLYSFPVTAINKL